MNSIKILVPFLVAVFEESIEKEELPPTLRQGLIKLIPKPNKDKLLRIGDQLVC